MKETQRGLLYGIVAYVIWGIAPIFWHKIQAVPAGEILLHRAVWSAALMAGILTLQRDWNWLSNAWATPRIRYTFFLTAALLTVNWLTYIWAVNNGHTVESSLGYFINPLVNVLLGMVFLKERLRRWQWLAVAFAIAGVAYLAWALGSLPWIALVLAFSFGFYGLLRKTAALNAPHGLTFETGLMSLPALIGLIWLAIQGQGHFGKADLFTNGMLILSGAVTAIPLLIFAIAARRIPLTAIGLLQYLAPTMQFAIGVWIFGEPFDQQRLIGFILIWVALVIYAIEGLLHSRTKLA
ncbi:MAG TPA: EamA family transporter RarD [Anaerolineales bacterium]|nr:EamA family transporter RarD [Anaerolineales bacterium]